MTPTRVAAEAHADLASGPEQPAIARVWKPGDFVRIE